VLAGRLDLVLEALLGELAFEDFGLNEGRDEKLDESVVASGSNAGLGLVSHTAADESSELLVFLNSDWSIGQGW
jgi:hypothetical protein